MSRRHYALLSLIALALGITYLAFVDYDRKLDTDVTNLLPKEESASSRILRSLISDRQGRLVYFALAVPSSDSATEAALRERTMQLWEQSPLVRDVAAMDGPMEMGAFQVVAERRLELLFPKWLAEKRVAYARLGEEALPFARWAAQVAVDELDAFLESPAAMELARPELLDPLLLAVRAIEAVGAIGGASGPGDAAGEDEILLFWAELAASPLLTETQDAVAALISQTLEQARAIAPGAEAQYGGLVRLAQASRERIHADVAKINLLSLGAVILVSIALVRPPWRFLWALPVAAFAVVGAASVSLLIFDTINVIVLVIGSILIGTSVDYAFHTLFAKSRESGFPTRQLLFYACLSTVVGFGILLFSEMVLIRQIGVFVAAGLACAYLGSQALPTFAERSAAGGILGRLRPPRWMAGALVAALALVVFGRVATLPEALWVDDIRKLEAPDPEVVAEDLALRERFGASAGRQVALSAGDSFASALESQAELLRALDPEEAATAGLAASQFLPTRSDLERTLAAGPMLPDFFGALARALEEDGYEVEAFGSFFDASEALANDLNAERFERALAAFSEGLSGPLTALLNTNGQQYWTAVSLQASPEALAQAVGRSEEAFLLSQLAMLNEHLNALRERLGWFGAAAMGLVGLTVMAGFGIRRGAGIIAVPASAVLFALAVVSMAAGPLNLFHLIGCFLGGALALDYALFGLEARHRGHALPYSVWLSAATTGASFLALSTSYIEAVRSLGAIVAIITLTTVVLLVSLQRSSPPAAPTPPS